MLFLLETIETAVHDYYSKLLYDNPLVYPIDVLKMKRVGRFRTFHFMITLEVTPVVGPYISVGKDRLTMIQSRSI
ncbi:DUF3888 domain-containing protein [Alkalihalobacillus sp. AL-G]|uniref:DUF3888 domain-containing protein n=1 Tax=Alkalihalobacillus sp. AL-G TaxID=2926399 RepID=UPI00272A3A62|nr:DUF3888 domain-containing protein [Alkalihalobacillus sp. AL-G]WLD92577.1 DUF3888 domain-containing protein [Alkalihalobacillus sp. AL-G]